MYGIRVWVIYLKVSQLTVGEGFDIVNWQSEINGETLRGLTLKDRFLGIVLGIADGISWIKHSKVSKQNPFTEDRSEGLAEFAKWRESVESLTYGLPLHYGPPMAKLVAGAADDHDRAEENLPRRYEGDNFELLLESAVKEEYWRSAEEKLQLRYAYLLYARDRNISPIEWESRFQGLSLTVRQKINHISFDKEIDEKAAKLARAEIRLWISHHCREYKYLYKEAVEIFRLLGYDDYTQHSAAAAWCYSCDQHDKAEKKKNEDLIKHKGFEKIKFNFEIMKHWINAGMGQVKFYQILLNGGRKEYV